MQLQDLTVFADRRLRAQLLARRPSGCIARSRRSARRSGGSRTSSATGCSIAPRATARSPKPDGCCRTTPAGCSAWRPRPSAARSRAAAGPARARGHRRERGRRSLAAAGHRASSRAAHPQVHVEVRRVASRQMAAAVLDRSLDFGVLTFQPAEKALQSVSLGSDELVMLAPPDASLASQAPRHDRGGRPGDRHRAQRSVAGARARAARSTSAGTPRSISRLRCRASTGSSARSKWGSASRCCRAGARWRDRARPSRRGQGAGAGSPRRSVSCSGAAGAVARGAGVSGSVASRATRDRETSDVKAV